MTTFQQEARSPDLGSAGETLSYEEFLKRYDGQHAEWVEGGVVLESPVSLLHQDISQFLTFLLDTFVRRHQLGKVTTAPFQMRLENSAREPDILFVAVEHLNRLKSTHLDGPADLVVEITSPESGGRDRGEKFYEYEAARVREYWLIDPLRQRAEFYQLDTNGLYQLSAVDAAGVYYSRMITGFWLKPAWLWQTPLPDTLEILRELRVIR